jgi:hypothetical protein
MTNSMANLYRRARELKDSAEYALTPGEREESEEQYFEVMKEISEAMTALEYIF